MDSMEFLNLKNLNYLIALLFSLFGIILSLILIKSTFKYLSSDSMTDDEKVVAMECFNDNFSYIFSMMAIIRFNYSKLFNY